MERVVEQAVQARHLVQAIYRKFHDEHGLPAIDPRPYSMTNHNIQIETLYQEAEAFRKNPVTTMTEQNFVIKKFFINLVSQARNVFFQANQETEAWLKEVMNPLVAQINEHKQQMEKRLKTLRKINESRDTLDARIHELEAEQAQLEKELEILNRLYNRLREPLPTNTASPAA
jgi:chromosome segregation ATPase